MKGRKSFVYLFMLVTVGLCVLILSQCHSNTGSGSNSVVNFDATVHPGSTYSYTFKNTGTYDYYCVIHQPNMAGKVIVSQNAQISGTDTVVMKNLQFNPTQVTVGPGTKIVWINEDNVDHEPHSGTPSSSSGGSYSY